MNQEDKDILLRLLQRHKELGISEQIDYQKFYLYSIITHSTAIEGSTVTEVEAQLLFDEGITSSKRTMTEQMMNLDLKTAYDYGMHWIRQHEDITIDWLVLLASKVMARTGSEYHTAGGDFSAAKGELRRLNVTAGLGGKSYMSYQKVPARLAVDHYLESISEKMVDKQDLRKIMVDKWSIKPSLAAKLVDILEFVTDKDEFTTEQIVSHFGFNATTAKRYLRQLTEFGYLEPHGGNKNRTYSNKKWNS